MAGATPPPTRLSAEVDGLIVFEGSTKKAQRVLVTGNAGAGKTTLAKDIARRLDIPFYSLDSIVWQSGWKKTPSEERTKMIESLVSSNTWIIDGVSVQVQERADMVIFIRVASLKRPPKIVGFPIGKAPLPHK